MTTAALRGVPGLAQGALDVAEVCAEFEQRGAHVEEGAAVDAAGLGEGGEEELFFGERRRRRAHRGEH